MAPRESQILSRGLVVALLFGVAGSASAGDDCEAFLSQFPFPRRPGAGPRARATVPADIDSDGDVDLVGVNVGNGVTILWNKGDGTFRRAAEIALADSPRDLAVGDLEPDGDTDIIVLAAQAGISGGDSNLFLVRNEGNASWTVESHVFPDDYDTLFAGDLDRDGDLDFILIARNGEITVVQNREDRGAGMFAVQEMEVGRQPRSITFTGPDEIGGHHLRMIVGEGSTELIDIEARAGRLGRPVVLMDDPEMASASPGDVDGDGILDLVICKPFEDKVTVLRGTASGDFGNRLDLPVSPRPWTATVADLDRDGDQDLVVKQDGNGLVSVLMNEGQGESFRQESYYVGPSNRRLPLIPADLDGDADLDLVDQLFEDRVTVIRNVGEGRFAAPWVADFGGEGGRWPLRSADLDGDGRPEVIFSSIGPTKHVAVLPNTGGGFGEPSLLELTSNIAGLEVFDVDLDGDQDLVTAEPAGRQALLVLRMPVGAVRQEPSPPETSLRGAGARRRAPQTDRTPLPESEEEEKDDGIGDVREPLASTSPLRKGGGPQQLESPQVDAFSARTIPALEVVAGAPAGVPASIAGESSRRWKSGRRSTYAWTETRIS